MLCVQRCHSEVVHSFLLFVVTHSPSMLENTQRPFLLPGCFVLIRIQKVQICGDVLMLLVPRPSNHEPASWQSERASSVCLWRLFASESPKSQSVGEARIQNCIAPDTFSQKSLKFFQVSPKAVSQLLMGFPYFAVYLVCENANKSVGVSGEFCRNGSCVMPRTARRAAEETMQSCRNTFFTWKKKKFEIVKNEFSL